jgi:hypothetical protein
VEAEPTNNGFPQLTLAEQGGTSSYYIPPTVDTENGSTINVQCCMGPPMINVDGTAYVEYENRNITNGVITSDTLYLFQINPDNSSSSTLLSSTTQNEALLPGPIVPDGQGGILATWTISPTNPPVPQYPYQAADVSNGVVGTPYNLPFSPQTVSFGDSPTIVLGENGTAFASGHTTTTDGNHAPVDQVVSFNITTGLPNWNYQAPQGALSLIQATADGGVTISDTDPGAIQIDASGNPSAPVPMLQGATPMDLGNWVSVANNALNMIWNPDGGNGVLTILAQSAHPMPHGNQQGQSTTPFCQRKNVNCALAPVDDIQTGPNQDTSIQIRQVTYWLFNLQNATLQPLLPSQNPPPVKIELWEANSTNSSASICSWQNPESICESPNPNPEVHDSPGQITDHLGAGFLNPYTVQQQFLVDRQGVQVFWPNSNGSWYGAWGTPESSPPGFQPNQTANVTTGWATISQIKPNTNAPTACASECDTVLPNAGPPSQ